MKRMFPLLEASQIECRMASVTKNGYSLLLYKTARTDMDILDEVVGPRDWQCEFYESGGQTYCRIGINVNFDRAEAEPRWVWKSDTGTPSNIEAQKGLASDARKRAGFAWGIGRELYTAPFIFINDPENVVADGYKYKLKPGYFPSFGVSRIDYNEDGDIAGLELKDDRGNVRYRFGSVLKEARKGGAQAQAAAPAPAQVATPAPVQPAAPAASPTPQGAIEGFVSELDIALSDIRGAKTKSALKAAHETWRATYGKYGTNRNEAYIKAVDEKTAEFLKEA